MEKSNVLFKGIMSALVTPIDADGNLMENAARKLMDWHLREGFSGFYICGGTGEGPVLQVKDRMRMAEIAKEHVGDRGHVISHVGAVDLMSAVKLAEHAGKIGLDAISSVPPFFFHYGEREIKQYYSAISEASGIPLLMYASPLSGVNITWDMVDRLMDIPNMIGLKWTDYNYFTMHRIKELRGGNINVINGPDETLLCGLTMGADGGIGATYNVMPKLFQKIYTSYQDGQMDIARATQYKANKVIEILLQYGVGVGIKDILQMIGLDCGYTVYPSKRFTTEEQAAFRAALKALRFEEEYL